MSCEKTGAHVYLEQYGGWVTCDIHKVGETWLLRTCPMTVAPSRPVKHATVHEVAEWFDQRKEYGTLVTINMTDHGYEGIPLGY